MGKITVKHYLNVNLKPYIINGEKYYTIYAIVTANRQNTKVKSNAFNEYYSESDFKEITDETNKEDFNILQEEAKTIENIANESINKVGNFDTTLFSAIYNYFQEIYIFDIDVQIYRYGNTEVDLYEKEKNLLGVEIDKFFISDFSMKENRAKGMSLYKWYSPTTQRKLIEFLKQEKCKIEINEAVRLLNDIILERSFVILNWILKGSKKYENLLYKYENLFENLEISNSYEKIGIKI